MTAGTPDNQYNLPPTLLKRYNQFKRIQDNNKRFQTIIEMGKKLPALEEEFKIEKHEVHGCTSLTHVKGDLVDGKMHYKGDSNSHIVKGLITLLITGFNEQSPEDILKIDPKFIEEMGLSQTLTVSRANGFMNAFLTMKGIAAEHCPN